MSTARGRVIIGLAADTRRLRNDLRGARKQLSKFQQGLGTMKSALIGLFAVSAIKNFISETVRLRDEQAKSEAQLLTALKGRKGVQQELIKQAGELQNKTIFGDEAIIKGQSLLASLGSNRDAIKQITPLVLDMAQAFNMDLNAAFSLVGKSLGSSTNALSRYGITIEGAVGSEERLKSATENLKKAFEGQAEAARSGAGGLQAMQNLTNDLKEKVGELILAFTASDGINRALIDFNTNLGDFVAGIKESKPELEFLGNMISGIFKALTAANIPFQIYKKIFGDVSQVGRDANKEQEEFNKRVERTAQVALKAKEGWEAYLRAIPEGLFKTSVAKEIQGLLKEIPPPLDDSNKPKGAPGAGTQGGAAPKPIFDLVTGSKELEKLHTSYLPFLNGSIVEGVAEVNTAITDLQQPMTELQIIAQRLGEGIEDSFVVAGDAMLDLAVTGETSAKKLARAWVDSAKAQVSASIAEGVSAAVASALKNVPFPLNLIAAGVAGTAATALFNKMIPSFATGINNFGGGLAVVGERGPELVNLPGGSSVIPNSRVKQGITINFNGLVTDPHRTAQEIKNVLAIHNTNFG